jgi:hypothetical protein
MANFFDRFDPPAEQPRRNFFDQFDEAPPAPSDVMAGSSFAGQQLTAAERSPWERVTSTFADAVRRGPVIRGLRAGVAGALNQSDSPDAQRLAQQVVEGERERRAQYEMQAASDPFYAAGDGLVDKVIAGAATLAGALAGGAADPLVVATLPVTGGSSLVRQMATQGALNLGYDALAQGADVTSGVQDQFSPEQSAVSTALGALFPVLGRAGGAAIEGVRNFRTREAAPPAAPAATPEPLALPSPETAVRTPAEQEAALQRQMREPALDDRRRADTEANANTTGPAKIYVDARGEARTSDVLPETSTTLSARTGENVEQLVEEQFALPADTFRNLPGDAKERIVAAQRARAAQQPSDTVLRTSDAVLGDTAYSPSSRPMQEAVGSRARGAFEDPNARRQPTPNEIETPPRETAAGAFRPGEQQPYARTSTGTSDRPFVAQATDNTDPGQARFFEDRARAEAETRRAETVEELIQRWERTRTTSGARSDAGAQSKYSKFKTAKDYDNRTTAGPDGRFPVDEFNYVLSGKGTPIRFGDQMQAARWVISAQRTKTDQYFEIANHPFDGWTVVERGRNPKPNSEPEAAGYSGGVAGAPTETRSPLALTAPNQGGAQASTPTRGDVGAAIAPAPGMTGRVDEPASSPIVDFVREARQALGQKTQPSRAQVQFEVGTVSPGEAARLKDATGLDLTGYRHVIDRSGVNHAFKRHGSESTEAAQGQSALTEEDWARVPDIIQNYDRVEKAPGRTKTGLEVIRYEKRYNGTTYYLEEIRVGRKTLAAASMWKKKSAATTSDAVPASRNPPSHTSETIRGASSVNQSRVGDPVGDQLVRGPTLEAAADTAQRATSGSGAPTQRTSPADGADPNTSPPKQSTNGPKNGSEPGSTLFANPLGPRLVKEYLADPVVRAVKRELAGFKEGFDDLRETFKSPGEKARAAGRSIERATRLAIHSNRAAMRAIERRYPKIAEAKKLIDDLATDPGTGRKIGETFETAATTHTVSMVNRFSNMLGRGPKDAALEKQIVDVLSGRAKGGGGQAETVARRVRMLLDEQHAYLRKAGLDVGYVREGYFPRVVNDEAVLANPYGFKAAASELYGKMGLSPEDAAKAADDWYSRVLGVTPGNQFVAAPGLPYSQATKGRTLPKDADKILADFYHDDLRTAVSTYLRQTTRKAEFARRFGANGEKAQEAFNAMLKQGMDARDVDTLRYHFESSTGMLSSSLPSTAQRAAAWVQTAGTLALLSRAVLSSLTEPLAIGVRSHSAMKGLRAFVDSGRQLFSNSADARQSRQAAEMLGIVGDAMTQQMLAARFGGGGMESALQQKILSGMFQRTGLHPLTEAQRVAAMRVGQEFLRGLLADVADNAPTVASAKRLLNELGLDDAGASAVRAWLNGKGGKPGPQDLLDDSDAARAYRTAITRFVNESIQNPEAVDRPAIANHPLGRMAYGIMSFMFAFTRNVLIRSAKEAAEAATGKGYTLQDRARLAAPAVAFMALAAAQMTVSQDRDAVFNPQALDERSDLTQTIVNLDRAGIFGTASPIVNMVISARYERDLSSLATGPYLAFYLENIGKLTLGLLPEDVGGSNTGRTNNAEWRSVRAAYSAVAAPAIAGALALAPGGPAMQAAYGLGMMTATSGGTSRAVADAVVGERTVNRAATPQNARRPSPRSGSRNGGRESAR